MRFRVRAVLASLFLIFPGLPAAAIHVTDIGGKEVVLRRGAPRARARAVETNGRGPIANASMTVTAAGDNSAADNDYRRIQDAINQAVAGDVITLSGTFRFDLPFSNAAWALGDDNTAGTGDDYSVFVAPGKNDVTLTATTLGSATIQGPGDDPTFDLEAFLFFIDGDNKGWTISNLRILDFDLAIGFFDALTINSFDDTTIQNNFIRIPTDLNATVAPSDSFQNIGIHFALGNNQSILGNTIHIPGDGVSDGANFSSSNGIQSNTNSLAYDGLILDGNIIHILNAPSANPELNIGFWENGNTVASDITVSNNSFINDAAGNDPASNLQRAFRVTSHSSATSLVTYDSNDVDGANIGIQWLSGADFSAGQAVVLSNNQITDSNTGVLVQSNGAAHFIHNVITGSGSGGGIHVLTGRLTGSGAETRSLFQNVVSGGSGNGVWIEAGAGAIAPMTQNDFGGNTGFGLLNATAPSIDAERNWWGNNLAASVAAEVSGNVDFDPWLASGTDVNGAAFAFQPFNFATTSGTITTFVGTAGADTGALLAGDPVTMMMSGETAFTALAQLLNFDIQLGNSDDVFTLGQTGIPTIFDGGAGNDTLVGTNVAQTWNITGAGSGNIPNAASSFTGVEAVRGGTAADSFIFGAAGSVALTLDGDLGIDTLDNTAIPAATITPTGPGTLDGFMGTATGVGTTFDNVNLSAGPLANLSITKDGPAQATPGGTISYTITVTNEGPSAAVDVELTDILPSGTTFSSLASPAGWSCTTPSPNATGTVTCTRLSMPVGSDVFTLIVNAPPAGGNVTNTASVTSANEGDAGDESDGATTAVASAVEIPTAGVWALLALAAILAVLASVKLRI